MLVDFCLLHELGTQFLASFAAALTFPTHNHYKVAIELPVPDNAKDSTGPPPAQQDATDEWAVLNEQLPYYVTLSCNYAVVISSLCGSFWEPSVPCNLVSAWLHPVLKEIPRKLGGGTPPLDPNGFPWTGCPQSFMDLAGSGPYFGQHSGESMVERVDAWRLLYLPVVEPDGLYYESFPFSPWQPVGFTKDKNCVFRVRAHESCPRHRLVYEYWTWQLPNGSTIHDNGLQSSEPRSYPETELLPPRSVDPVIPLSDQEASREEATEVFRWVLANHEGKPASEPIYHDDWIADCDYSDGSLQESAAGDTCSMPDTSNQGRLSIVEWMDGVEIS
ncbi:hypothetical protein CIHG_07617 [Coccidioides immitis H538.4]|uniref:Uncharacterized protein n=1 Tax=Coccidioides immitis H538.4 TaxID=396776 RepID=A0A0J8S0K7_COCIT|nr:hypothetical protein CIHG_07617 [Coccidioides immitis H538.4]